MAGSKSRKELLESTQLPSDWKIALEELPAMLELAQSFGLNVGGAYQRIDIDANPVSYIVVAADPKTLSLHQWEFPIVGKAPYKGFRYESHAEAERARMELKGWVADTYPVSAFSSLGWFPETLPGGLLYASETYRARVIFHELVHRTIFYPGRADLNESLANYLGDELARKWFIARDGLDSPSLKQLKKEIEDSAQLREYLHQLIQNWSPETINADIKAFEKLLHMESWQSQIGQQNSVRKWSLPTILMEQVYDAGAWPWATIWEECDRDVEVLNWHIRQNIVGTP